MSNKSSTVTWNEIDWAKTQKNIRQIQYRIYKARLNGNFKKLHWLQNFLINNSGAKMLAIHQVTTLNKENKDKQIITKPEKKIELAKQLSIDGCSQPIRKVWIPKPIKEERKQAQIPIIRDRAKQALVKLALEPEWEAVFEPNSYGFRPGRSALDAIEGIFLSLHYGKPKWIYNADIRKCFETINHKALLEKFNTIPILKRQIAAWLKAGIMEEYANTKKDLITTTGIKQGHMLSPLLANIALHGLEIELKNFVSNLAIKPHSDSNRGTAAKRKALTIIRYADDFVLIHQNKEILELCIYEVKKWLNELGLEINEQQSVLKVKDGRCGFEFLGFHIIQVKKKTVDRYKVKIYPSRKSQQKLLLKVRDIIQHHKAVSAYQLIMMLRPIIIGWANYFKYCECQTIFTKLSHLIFEKIRAWVFRRDTRRGRIEVKEKYFPSGKSYNFDGKQHFDNWILVGKEKDRGGNYLENFLPHLSWVSSKKHVKVLNNQTPFNKDLYWAIRSVKYSPYSRRVQTLLIKQKQLCPICNQALTFFDSNSWELDHIKPKSQGGKDEYNNLQLVHKECHIEKTRIDKLDYK
uniref:Putative reverse transcriptase, intron maturase and HNH homing endonuclease n=1 Tax=Jenufa perforata TaxID=993091 RepID=A0A0S2LP28_9CHLO|nr:putative reverse transcriptase, intron maturase and HNH homing endonuclease [Jenufa perforata]ALO62920.1 putative reverse transcriptase, intron maturase and HNH homing endonuclease [Jenufa perforata]